MYFVYGLFDPRDGKLRYVGFSCNPKRRYKEHINMYHLKRSRTRNTNWVLHLRNNDMRPIMKIIETCGTVEQGVKQEAYWIRYFRKKNCKLNNHLDGGDGTTLASVSDESRKRISDKLKEYYKENPEARLQISIRTKLRMKENGHHFQGVPCSEERKKKIGDANRGRIQTKKEKIKRANAMKKPIICNELNRIFPSQKDAGEILNIDSRSINKVVLGKRKTAGGYTFSYYKGDL